MTNLELLMDYFDFSGLISPQKEITATADKYFPRSGKNRININNLEQDSPTKETKEEENRILTKIKTKKRCGNEKIMKIAKKVRKSDKTKNGQREHTK